ncbi:MAG: NAD-dependent epimerase/dehydratase family protein, partial [Moraxellaceae bacterium]|nr:NAD-dependent epimerase/dehydratase family protein [Moraxellaceae bacterium]
TDAPLEPTQSYPISKASASVAWTGFGRERHVSVSILRIFQVYGEGEVEGRMWPSLRAAALAGKNYSMTKGEQIRDFIEVGEVAKQFLTELAVPALAGEQKIRHIGSGHPQSLRDFAEHWWKYWRAKGRLELGQMPYRANEVMRFVPLLDSR